MTHEQSRTTIGQDGEGSAKELVRKREGKETALDEIVKLQAKGVTVIAYDSVPHGGRAIDLTGMRFTRLLAVGITGRGRCGGQLRWVCACDCGNVHDVVAYALTRSLCHSCGCYYRDVAGKASTTHGEAGKRNRTPEYATWARIKNRCTNPKVPEYPRYGGRGITMCKRWDDSYKSFLDDMGRKPSPNHSIDRIDNDGSYSCGKCSECRKNKWKKNCRWATWIEQQNNRSSNRLHTHLGRTQTISQWAREANISPFVLYTRIIMLKWETSKALSEPVEFRKPRVKR